MLSNRNVVRNFLEGRASSSRHVQSDGQVLYSYGKHFPMAMHFGENTLLVNSDRYSNTTSQHQAILRNYISHYNMAAVYLSTKELQEQIASGKSTLVLIRNPEGWKENLDGLIESLKKLKVHKSRRDKIGEVVQDAIAGVSARML